MSLTEQLRLGILLLVICLLSHCHASKKKVDNVVCRTFFYLIVKQKEESGPIVEYEYDDDDETLDDVVVEGDIMLTPDDERLNAMMTTDLDRWANLCRG